MKVHLRDPHEDRELGVHSQILPLKKIFIGLTPALTMITLSFRFQITYGGTGKPCKFELVAAAEVAGCVASHHQVF